jgi:hypothetical protein
MRLTLPSDFGQKWLGLVVAAMALGCHGQTPPPVTPGEPIPAEADVVVDTMDKECDGLIAAVTAYGACPNADEETREWTRRVVEAAQQAFEAGKKGDPKPDEQHVIALACRKAAVSMQNATTRCQHGKPPKTD